MALKIHIPGLPHTVTAHGDPKWQSCAFTQKVVKMCRMMHNLGHEIIHYGNEGANVPCEHVAVCTEEERNAAYPVGGQAFYNFNNQAYNKLFSDRVAEEVKKRTSNAKNEFFLLPFGWGHEPIARQLPEHIHVESGIGYPSTVPSVQFKVYESYALMHYFRGLEDKTLNYQAKWWNHVVIPNHWDPYEFEFCNDPKGDYFLFIGRLNEDKGIYLACQIAKELGKKIICVGKGDIEKLKSNHPEADVRGAVGAQERSDLMKDAISCILPTFFTEPFGGTNVETQFCGTPTITTDWGAMTETVLHGVTGYRCRHWDEFLWAAKNVHKLDRQVIRNWAVDNYSLDKCAKMYEHYFNLILDYRKNWYHKREPQRNELNWLTKCWPHK